MAKDYSRTQRIGDQLRSVPQLHFHYDESIRRGAELSALIERAVAEDGRRHGDETED